MFAYAMQPVVQPVEQQAGCRVARIKQVEFIQTVEQPVECLYARYTACCETGLTTGCIVYTNIQPVVQLVIQPVVSCKRSLCLIMYI